MMPLFRRGKAKEKQEDTRKRPQKSVYFFFSIKVYAKKSDIEYFRVPDSKIW